MVFTEFRFLIFFALAFAVHWALPSHRSRKAWLLICSYSFYAAWDWRFLSLILLSTVVDFIAGGRIARSSALGKRRFWLGTSLTINLGLLGYFKYCGWFLDSTVEFLGWLGFSAHTPTLAVILPVGISFYTFQTLSYTIDIYYRKIEPTESKLDMAVFVGFFPQLVAGPIVRARDFLWQLEKPVRLATVDVKGCLILFLIGYMKKDLVADFLAAEIDPFFSDPSAFTAASAWIAMLLYIVQLYCDCSSYSDMAIATAGLLGYRLCENFYFPWFATNLAGFWRRWHISMSGWMRDYVYIPLGGAQGTEARIAFNTMATMLVIGLWHGANWTFFVFGALHGLGLIVYRLYSNQRGEPSPAKVHRVIACLGTFYFIVLTAPYFRAADVGTGTTILKTLLTLSSPGAQSIGIEWLGVWAVLVAIHWFVYLDIRPAWWSRVPDWAFAAGFGAAFSWIFSLGEPLADPFIYFQF